jgi:hypothetical protein
MRRRSSSCPASRRTSWGRSGGLQQRARRPIRGSRPWWSLPNSSIPTEISLFKGTGDQGNSYFYGDYTSLTVDPADDCTFWYVNEYFTTTQTTTFNWHTRISNFKAPGCN